MEHLFDVLLEHGIADDGDWARLVYPGGLFLSQRQAAGGAIVRSQFELDIPIKDVMVFARPEVFFHRRRPEFDPFISECGTEDVLSPGDAICWSRFRSPPYLQRLLSLANGDFWHAAGKRGRCIWSARHRFRFAMRKDFPTQGKLAIALAPLHPETSEMLEEWGVLRSSSSYIEALGSDKTRLVGFGRAGNLMTWVLPLVVGRHMGIFQWMHPFRASPLFHEARSGDLSYMVLSIRRIQGSKPLLLPSLGAAGEVAPGWQQTDGFRSFSFPGYLREFAIRTGVNIPIYSSIDGWDLVPLQAAVNRGAWNFAWRHLSVLFREQRVMFRKLYGGRHCPEISFDGKPRFARRSDAVPASRQMRRRSSIPQQNTFIHFSLDDAPCCTSLQRSNSEPTLDVPTA